MLIEAYRKGNETKSSNWPSRTGALQKIVLGAGLEPASLSAYAPQTYVSASSTTRASRGSKLSADDNGWQVSSAFFLVVVVIRRLRTNRISLPNEVSAIRDKLRAR